MNDAVDIVDSSRPLEGCRVIAMLNGTELFGHEKGNIEAYKVLRDAGADVCVGVTHLQNGGDVRKRLESLQFRTFTVPFGYHWSKQWFVKHPTLIFQCVGMVIRSSAALMREIRRFRATHVLVGHPLVYSYIAPALSLSRLPVIYRAGDEPPYESWPNLKIWKACAARANSIVAISDFIQERFMKVVPALAKKTRVIHNLVPQSPGVEDTAPWNDEYRHVIYLGQIAEHKGVSHFIEAAKDLCAIYPDVVFDLLGGSQHSRDFEQQLRNRVTEWNLTDRIRFHGSVSNPQAYLKAADLHVAPSIFEEPLGNVALEAKLAAIPSVVFPSGGLPEMIRHEVDGFICHEKTVGSLVEGISFFLEDVARTSRAGQDALEDLSNRFGLSRFRDEWIQVFTALK